MDRGLTPTVAEYSRAEGARAMAALLRRDPPPDAVFCFSDLLALGALRTLAREGVRVPADVAVVGFDDIEEAGYATPTLTTVAPDRQALARSALELLEDRIAGRDVAPRDRRVPHRLVVRESTGGTTA